MLGVSAPQETKNVRELTVKILDMSLRLMKRDFTSGIQTLHPNSTTLNTEPEAPN